VEEMMYQQRSLRWLAVPLFVLSLVGGNPLFAATDVEIFRGFTGHIGQQIGKDKDAFAIAQSCTTWFYRQLKKHQKSPVTSISFSTTYPTEKTMDCLSRYPDGLNGARKAFGNTQKNLSLSLTFYQLALVGDGNDDGQYNGQELRDVLESFGMSGQPQHPPRHYLVTLNGIFDRIRETVEFPALMKSIERLFGKGYRFTPSDQVALNQKLE